MMHLGVFKDDKKSIMCHKNKVKNSFHGFHGVIIDLILHETW